MAKKIKKKNLKCATLKDNNNKPYTTCYDKTKAKKAPAKKKPAKKKPLLNKYGIDITPGQKIGTYKGKTIYKPTNKEEYQKYSDDAWRAETDSSYFPKGIKPHTRKALQYEAKYPRPDYPDLFGTDLSFNVPDEWDD